MSDITKCSGTDCPLKEKCKRFTAPQGFMQSWFLDVPFTIVDGKFSCDMYWGENAEMAWQTLQDAIGTNPK